MSTCIYNHIYIYILKCSFIYLSICFIHLFIYLFIYSYLFPTSKPFWGYHVEFWYILSGGSKGLVRLAAVDNFLCRLAAWIPHLTRCNPAAPTVEIASPAVAPKGPRRIEFMKHGGNPQHKHSQGTNGVSINGGTPRPEWMIYKGTSF